jgi:hypothetical protein
LVDHKSQQCAPAYTRQCIFVILAALSLLSFATQLHAATVTATWNPNPEPNIAGYSVSYGTTSGSYTTTVDVGKVTSAVMTVTAGQKYYFAVRAYNTGGAMSPYSAEVSATVSGTTSGPSIVNLSPSSGAVGTMVTVAGANFGSTKGTSTVTFNGTAATPTTWSASSIAVPAPAGATTGNVVVTVGGIASNGQTFTVSGTTPAAISFVQQNYATPQSATASVSVPFTAAQTAGNLNVVVIGWNDSTRTLQSVQDSKGNAYVNAVGPTVLSGQLTQSIYYAKNIAAAAAGANSVTVTFSGAASAPDVRIAEYRGIDSANPFDTAIGAAGASTTSDSGALTTKTANALLVGANTVTAHTNAAGAGYTSRVITSPDGDILEDRVVSATGSYNATAPLSGGSWVMQVVAFRAASGASSTAPSIASLSPVSGAVGTAVMITGSNFGSTKGTSTVMFNGTTATPTTWSATSIAVPVPAGATTGNVVVTVGGVASNALAFTVATSTAPSITSLSPVSGAVGTAVTITGSNFGSSKGTSTVTFNGTTATPTTWSATSIVVPVPAGAATGNVVVTVGGVASNAKTFTVTTSTSPSITSLTPASGPVGTVVTIVGSNFGATKGTSSVWFNGTLATPTSWSATSIVVPVPTGATTGNVGVTVGAVASNGQMFTVTTPAAISFVQQNYATPQSPTASVAVPFAAVQTAANLNVVVVGWNDATRTVQSVADSKGNAYIRAVGPTIVTGSLTQSIYYAKNIVAAAAGANTVTVTFSGTAAYPDVRVAEYRGLDPVNPLDGAVAGTGTSLTSDSGALTTTTANDLLVGANTVTAHTTAAGTGYTSRVITSPDGDILEDRVVTATGSYNATAPVSGGSWVTQLVAFRAASGGVAGAAMMSATVVPPAPSPDDSSRASDYDGDARSDLAVFTPSTGKWAVLQSSSNYMNGFSLVLGTSTDVPVPGDYDGDGKADIAVYTPSTGKWSVLKSTSAYASSISTTWGASGDLPVPGDYDGDGKTDFAVYRPSTGEWLLTLSATQTTKTIVLGAAGDKPVAGDYDGDGRTDVAIFRPSTGAWTVLTSSSNYASQLTGTVGTATDLLVPGDYDGDGRMDMAVYRPSTGSWLILGSASGYATSRTVILGSSGDIPVPSDYDADGTTDVAVYRPSTGQWTIMRSTDGSALTSVWGTSGSDVPLPRHP